LYAEWFSAVTSVNTHYDGWPVVDA